MSEHRFEDAEPLRIAVIGGGGFVGARIMAAIRNDPRYHAVAVLRSYRGIARLGRVSERRSHVSIVAESSATALAEQLRGCDSAINVSSGSSTDIRSDTRIILDACRIAGVKRLLHTSSAAVFGRRAASTIEENRPASPDSWMLYGRGKAEGEQEIADEMAKEVISIVVLRPGLIWGPGAVWSKLVGEQLANGRAALPIGGRGIANLVYVENLVRVMLRVAENQTFKPGFYNISDPEVISWERYYTALAVALGYPISAVALYEQTGFHISNGALLEWVQQRGGLLKLIRALPTPLLGRIKTMARWMTQDVPRPPIGSEASVRNQLRLSRQIRDLQLAERRPPCDRVYRELGAIQLTTFDEAIRRTAAWLRFAGFGAAGPRVGAVCPARTGQCVANPNE